MKDQTPRQLANNCDLEPRFLESMADDILLATEVVHAALHVHEYDLNLITRTLPITAAVYQELRAERKHQEIKREREEQRTKVPRKPAEME